MEGMVHRIFLRKPQAQGIFFEVSLQTQDLPGAAAHTGFLSGLTSMVSPEAAAFAFAVSSTQTWTPTWATYTFVFIGWSLYQHETERLICQKKNHFRAKFKNKYRHPFHETRMLIMHCIKNWVDSVPLNSSHCTPLWTIPNDSSGFLEYLYYI